jgi:hypothetical protein
LSAVQEGDLSPFHDEYISPRNRTSRTGEKTGEEKRKERIRIEQNR